ncbi:MAG: alpha/beta fold hydrolase [Chloroflexi bacterium]|nr:alpha/beta fold hydrolase [Chloroflexota bacterium]
MPTFRSGRSGGVTLSYDDHGSGSPVVLAHGMSESTALWAGQIGPVADRYRLILWDNRGHGRSEAPAGQEQYSVDLYAADLLALLDHLGIDRACVGGLSMGGYTAVAFAVTYPDRLSSLVLADTAPGEETIPNRPPAEQAIRERLPLEELALREGMAAVARRTLADGTAPAEALADPVQRARYVERLTRLSVNGYIWAWRSLRSRPSYTARLGEIQVPTLCIAGERDEFLPAVQLLAERIPKAEMVVIPNAGHTSNVDQPDLFNRALVDFLARVTRSKTAAEVGR